MHLPLFAQLRATELTFLPSWSDSRAQYSYPLSVGPIQSTHFIYFYISGLSKISDTSEELNEGMNKYFAFKGASALAHPMVTAYPNDPVA